MVTTRRKPPAKERAQSHTGSVVAPPAVPAKHILSVRFPTKLHADLKVMSEALYRSINSLLVDFARERVKEWKDEVAREAATSRRLRRQGYDEGDEDA